MSILDYIYLRLCQKYGEEEVALKKSIKTIIQYNSEGTEIEDSIQYVGKFYFYCISLKKPFDLQKEKDEGLFNGFDEVEKVKLFTYIDVEFEVIEEK